MTYTREQMDEFRKFHNPNLPIASDKKKAKTVVASKPSEPKGSWNIASLLFSGKTAIAMGILTLIWAVWKLLF
ncbi:MAG: hypothetical protein NTZ87_00240 [Candidatus Nomurabacteria bacterium]|nr:hypothetical protein [Candidatus Nomurabacteria bacterium]